MISPRLKQAFLLLLRQGLWKKVEETAGLFPLQANEWTEVREMAQKQTVQGIVYDGICLLPPAFYPPRSLFLSWTVETDTLERINKQHRKVLDLLTQLHTQVPATPFLLLKGIGIADFYPTPGHRLAGDIDLWFGNEEQTEAANQRLEQLGLTVKRGANGEAACLINGVLIEHHSHLIDLHNPYLQSTLRQWEAGIFADSERIPSPVANHLLLSTHILKHLINEGIGLRQLCDVAMTLAALSTVTDSQELERISRRWHIYRWNQLLYALLVKYLGLPTEYLPFPTHACPDRLIEEVWESGNFGHGDERYGNRPTGKWANKRYTVKRIVHKLHLSFGYAADETFWWLAGLITTRLRELVTRK